MTAIAVPITGSITNRGQVVGCILNSPVLGLRDGPLFYPDMRASFENPTQDDLDAFDGNPFIPDTDISPI